VRIGIVREDQQRVDAFVDVRELQILHRICSGQLVAEVAGSLEHPREKVGLLGKRSRAFCGIRKPFG
jgi:hypothetical protein